MHQKGQVSSRPGFPQGMQVLVLDQDHKERRAVEAQLLDCRYAVTSCSSSADAVAQLTRPGKAFDLLLVDADCLMAKTADNRRLVQLARAFPLILMSANSDPNQVLLGIKLGAADFLQKPLCEQKVKTIWLHVVKHELKGLSSFQSDSGTEAEVSSKCTAPNSAFAAASHLAIPTCTSPVPASPASRNSLDGLANLTSLPSVTNDAVGCVRADSPGLVKGYGSHNSLGSATEGPDKLSRRKSKDVPSSPSKGTACKLQPATSMNVPSVAPTTPAPIVSLGMTQATLPNFAAFGTMLPNQAVPLPQGCVWGAPLNPFAKAPGISPPCLPPPTGPVPMWGLLPPNLQLAAVAFNLASKNGVTGVPQPTNFLQPALMPMQQAAAPCGLPVMPVPAQPEMQQPCIVSPVPPTSSSDNQPLQLHATSDCISASSFDGMFPEPCAMEQDDVDMLLGSDALAVPRCESTNFLSSLEELLGSDEPAAPASGSTTPAPLAGSLPCLTGMDMDFADDPVMIGEQLLNAATNGGNGMDWTGGMDCELPGASPTTAFTDSLVPGACSLPLGLSLRKTDSLMDLLSGVLGPNDLCMSVGA